MGTAQQAAEAHTAPPDNIHCPSETTATTTATTTVDSMLHSMFYLPSVSERMGAFFLPGYHVRTDDTINNNKMYGIHFFVATLHKFVVVGGILRLTIVHV